MKLSTPAKIQDYINTLDVDCLEGARIAAVKLHEQGEPPLLLDLSTADPDVDHVVALFKRHGHWGAISRTRHAVLRYREPVYETIHELVMSYFHEYFLDDGKKTLRNYAGPLNLLKMKDDRWMTKQPSNGYLEDWINAQKHYDIVDAKMIRSFRKADSIEIEAGKIIF